MHAPTMPKPLARAFISFLTAGALLAAATAARTQPLFGSEINRIGEQGFGDRQNSQAWSMAWWPCSPMGCQAWQNKLYVGTGRAIACMQQATLHYFQPDRWGYPPNDPDISCTPDARDLPLQAEIWRWTPETNLWERIYQSPNDVPIPGTTKFTARDIGFRGMLVFKEADGTEALYVSGDSTRGGPDGIGFDGAVPPPRLLRSVDGVHFEAVPFDPDQVLGSTSVAGYRTPKAYNGRLYVVGSLGQLGQGVLLEAAHPELGAFRQVSGNRPDGQPLTFFEIETYNGFLWGGTGVNPQNDSAPFSLLKTDATGDPPYTFTTVIPAGAYRQRPSPAVISMHAFDGRLFVGTDSEILRVNPDDTWDVVVGDPRRTPDGRKLEPLSGFQNGFDNIFNIHIWRMGTYASHGHLPVPWLYVGTHDQSTKWRNIPWIGTILEPGMGFDLYATPDGWHYSAVTVNGFGDKFNNGLRNFAVTPYGFFIGAANHFYGEQLYLGKNVANPVGTPRNLEAERVGKVAGLVWEGAPTAVKFHVFRSSGFDAPTEIGSTNVTPASGRAYLDNIKPFRSYHYYVVAEDANGNVSEPSNVVPIPFKGPVPTFKLLEDQLARWKAPASMTRPLNEAKAAVRLREWQTALDKLQEIGVLVTPPRQPMPYPYQSEDLGVLLTKFTKRVLLAQAGLLPAWMLMR